MKRSDMVSIIEDYLTSYAAMEDDVDLRHQADFLLKEIEERGMVPRWRKWGKLFFTWEEE